MFKIILFFLILNFASAQEKSNELKPYTSADQIFYNFDKDLAKDGILETYTPEGLEKLKAKLQVTQKSFPPKDETIVLLKHGEELIDESKKSNDEEKIKYSFWLGKRILYSAQTEANRTYKTPLFAQVNKYLDYYRTAKVAKNIIKRESVGEPYWGFELNQKKEEKDVWDGHPLWLSKNEIKNINKKYGSNENRIQQFLTKSYETEINSKNKSNISVSLERVSDILVFDKIKTTATSPKAEAIDAYGISWKIKWGEEAQTQTINTALYYKLGGRFILPTYLKVQPENRLTLVLSKPSDDKTCKTIPTKKQFIKCMFDSVYMFNPIDYVEESGVITAENISVVLAKYPANATSFKKEELIGRVYLKFKEASVLPNLPKKYVIKTGHPSLGQVGTNEDLAYRGSLLLSELVQNIDTREMNVSSYLLNNFDDDGKVAYVEGIQDLGASLGSLFSSGQVNSVFTGDRFAEVKHENGKNPYLRFKPHLVYSPNVWKYTDANDARWMMDKITALSKGDFQEIVARSQWPDFLQEAFVYKLISRRNQIAKAMGYDEISITAPNFSIPLTNDDEIEHAAKTYHLDKKDIIDELKRFDLYEKNYTDKILVDGYAKGCHQTVLISLMEKANFPSGLIRRTSRRFDNETNLRACYFGSKPRPSGFTRAIKQMVSPDKLPEQINEED